MPLKLQQALYGYDAGHNLLATSVDLSQSLRRALAVVTDLSGRAVPQFERCYIGFRPPATRLYVLFCTWLAPEMPRPGCVWSHVLLFEPNQLSEISDTSLLRELFRRPRMEKYEYYRSPIVFDAANLAPSGIAKDETSRAALVLNALYGHPDRDVVLFADSSADYEKIVFSVWSQQWPAQRNQFYFSTGSFSERGQSEMFSFDLQIAPTSSRRAWREANDRYLFVLADSPEREDEDVDSWLDIALSDLESPKMSSFRAFCGKFGKHAKNGRTMFAPLALAYQSLTFGTKSGVSALEYIAHLFPSAENAVELKQHLITEIIASDLADAFQSLQVAEFLLNSSDAAAFSEEHLDFQGLASVLWKARRSEVIEMLAQLVRRPENSKAIAFARAVAQNVGSTELVDVWHHHPEVLSLIVGMRPELARESAAWRLPENAQWRLYEGLEQSSLTEKGWSPIVAAMLEVNKPVVANEAVAKAGLSVMDAAFDWFRDQQKSSRLPSAEWRAVLQDAAATFMEQTQLSPVRLAFTTWFLSPVYIRGLSAARSDIQELARTPLDDLPEVLRIPTAFFLVTLGLRAEKPEGVQLVSRGFFTVYEALGSNTYPADSWRLIQPELPELAFWNEWDRCKKLRRGVEQALERLPGLIEMLVAQANTPERHKMIDELSPSNLPATA